MRSLLASPADTAARLGLDLNGIFWCDATLNPGLYGCAYASPACGTADRSSQCYAESMAARIVRMGGPAAALYREGVNAEGRWTGRVSVHPERIASAFAKLPKRAGRIRRVFVTSMSDLFHADVPFDFLDRVFHAMWARPHLVFQVLTKRPDRMAEYAAERLLQWPANVWAGCTVEDQRRADERIPHLLRVPAAVRFLSVEPMLGRINIFPQPIAGLQWVIVGSESAGNAPGLRETNPSWVLDLVDQCDAAGVPVLVKQLDIGGQLCSLPLVNGKVRADFPEVPRG